MSSMQVRVLLCDALECPNQFIHPAQLEGGGMVNEGQLRTAAGEEGWKVSESDLCPDH